MEGGGIYDALILVFSANVDFSIVFDDVDDPYFTEILNFIDFVKKNPSKEKISTYNVSHVSKKIILDYLNDLFNKARK